MLARRSREVDLEKPWTVTRGRTSRCCKTPVLLVILVGDPRYERLSHQRLDRTVDLLSHHGAHAVSRCSGRTGNFVATWSYRVVGPLRFLCTKS